MGRNYLGAIPEKLTRQLHLINGVDLTAIAGTETWTGYSANLAMRDPGGAARQINLPDEAASDGLFFIFVNTTDGSAGTEIVTFKASDAATTVVAVDTAEAAILMCDGTTWDGFIITGSLT